MAESTTLESILATSPDIQTDAATPSDERLEETPAPVEAEAASPDHGSESETPPEPDYESVQAKIDSGEALTTAEKDIWRKGEQARQDRERSEAQARSDNAQARQLLQQANEVFDQSLYSLVEKEYADAEREGRAPSETILRAAIKAEKDAFVQGIQPLLMRGLDTFLKSQIHDIHPDKAVAEKVIHKLESGKFNFGETLKAYTETVAAAAKLESVDAKELAKLRDENARLKKQITQEKGEQGRGNSPAGGGGTPATGKLTKAEWSGMTTAQRAQAWIDRPNEVRAL